MKHTCTGNAFFTSLQTSEDVPQRVFKTIKDLIYAYEKPNQGLIINLRYPVRRPRPSRSVRNSRVHVDEDYDGRRFISVFLAWCWIDSSAAVCAFCTLRVNPFCLSLVQREHRQLFYTFSIQPISLWFQYHCESCLEVRRELRQPFLACL